MIELRSTYVRMGLPEFLRYRREAAAMGNFNMALMEMMGNVAERGS